MAMVENQYLLNFAASYSGGGLKRLRAYASWFHHNGGAAFIVHANCEHLKLEYPNNQYFIARQSRLQRIFDDYSYLAEIQAEFGVPELYYSYGIPIYRRAGRVNWFHLSNVLLLESRGIPTSMLDRATFIYLGSRVRQCLRNADIVSAESQFSLRLLADRCSVRGYLSVNGADDELSGRSVAPSLASENVAAVVGTYRYKALDDSARVFDMLRRNYGASRLLIMGDPNRIPRGLRERGDVEALGMLKHDRVIEHLRKAKFYVSTTLIENSYNAASEGIFNSEESFVSDIEPHRELLAGTAYSHVQVEGCQRPLLHVRREWMTGANLMSWDAVVGEMIAAFRKARDRT